MKHVEWLEVGRRELALWPNQPWEPTTMAAAFELFKDIEQPVALKAIMELAADGREFAPAPGVVLARTLQIVIASTPALPEPDLTRELTPEEAERAKRMATALSGAKARLVQATWLEFSRHSRSCPLCGRVAARCRQSGMASRTIDSWIDDCCREGKLAYEPWREAVFDLVGAAAVQLEARV